MGDKPTLTVVPKAGGRPTKYRREFCQQLIDYILRTGEPFHCFAAEIGISEDTLYEWARKHKEFSESKKIALAIAKRNMTRVGLSAMAGKIKGFQMGAFAMIMKNCYGWEDNPEAKEEDIDDVRFD
jgi:hypothetical protein